MKPRQIEEAHIPFMQEQTEKAHIPFMQKSFLSLHLLFKNNNSEVFTCKDKQSMSEGKIENLGSNGDAGVESSSNNFFKA